MRFFWLNVHLGYDFSFFMGKPLSYYNFEALKKEIEQLEIEYNNQ